MPKRRVKWKDVGLRKLLYSIGMIEKDTGRLRLSDSFHLSPSSKFDSVVNQKLGEVQEVRDMENGWIWLDIKNLVVDDTYFIISLCFENQELAELSFVTQDKPFKLESDWNSWSERDQKKKLEKYEKWLSYELGRERLFKWGEVWSSYDSRSGSSSIGMRYKK